MNEEIKIKHIGNIYGPNRGKGYAGNVWDKDGLCPTITCVGGGGNRQPLILAYDEQNRTLRKDGTVGCLTSDGSSPKHNNRVVEMEDTRNKVIRIRKLTPKECWRLMGFDDESFDKAAQVNSNTQLYRQAGNSIVVDVLEYIFKKML